MTRSPEPPVYAIGDVQGCYSRLNDLIQGLPDADRAQLWFAGDLINRGPESLATLRAIKALGERAVCVLGNHDLHLLAVAAGVREPSAGDTLDDILTAPDCEELIYWLRHQPLAWFDRPYLLVHAGVHPEWTVKQTLRNAQQVQQALQGDDWKNFLHEMYGNTPKRWSDMLTGANRRRIIVNVLTRMRMIDESGQIDMKYKGAPRDAPSGLHPWFMLPGKLGQHTT
ncbi:MAG: symmetrical bis(5'-nucleosyl)-tetraphosphatase, partial [Burkholderiaceae bacterium]